MFIHKLLIWFVLFLYLRYVCWDMGTLFLSLFLCRNEFHFYMADLVVWLCWARDAQPFPQTLSYGYEEICVLWCEISKWLKCCTSTQNFNTVPLWSLSEGQIENTPRNSLHTFRAIEDCFARRFSHQNLASHVNCTMANEFFTMMMKKKKKRTREAPMKSAIFKGNL